MTNEEAKEVFLNRGYIQVKGGRIYDGDKWRQSIVVISKWLEQEPCEDCISRAELKEYISKDESTDFFKGWNRVIEAIYATAPSIQPKPKTDVLDKIRAEIKEWYWQADKQALAKDPCVVDAMIDLFIRTIDKYTAESEG